MDTTPGTEPDSHQPAITSHNDVENTSRDTTIAQWGVATVVMAGSMAAGGFTFHYLGENPALGVITALAVDLALAAWLRIDRRLRDVGVTVITGRVLEGATLSMTLFLNIGAAVFRGIHDSPAARVFLAVGHSFLPIVLFLISVAGGEAQTKLAAVRRRNTPVPPRDTVVPEPSSVPWDVPTATQPVPVPRDNPVPHGVPRLLTVPPNRDTAGTGTPLGQGHRDAPKTVPGTWPTRVADIREQHVRAFRTLRDTLVRDKQPTGKRALHERLGVPERVVQELITRAKNVPTLSAVPGGVR